MNLQEMIDAANGKIQAYFTLSAGRDDKALTAEELTAVEALQSSIEGWERQAELEEKLNARNTTVITPVKKPASLEAKKLDGDGTELTPALDAEGDKYADVYAGDMVGFALDVRNTNPNIGSAVPNVRLQKYLNAYSEETARIQAVAPTQVHEVVGTDEGGFMVPPDYLSLIWEVVSAEEGIFGSTQPVPTSQNQVTFAADESTPWSADGIQANWIGEAEQMTPSKLSTQGRLTRLDKIFAFVNASDEILEDAPRLNNRLTVKAPQAIRFKIDEAIVNGNGVGKPLGWTNSAAMISVAKQGGQAADTINVNNITKMYMRMFPSSLSNAVWFCNADIFEQLVVMTIGDRPIYTSPQTGIVNAPAGTLFGRPIVFSEHAKTLGDFGDIQFVDMGAGYYSTNKAGGIKFATSIHLYFDYDVQSFRWTIRVGGQPYLSAPMSPQYGANTLSHFVGLAARA